MGRGEGNWVGREWDAGMKKKIAVTSTNKGKERRKIEQRDYIVEEQRKEEYGEGEKQRDEKKEKEKKTTIENKEEK